MAAGNDRGPSRANQFPKRKQMDGFFDFPFVPSEPEIEEALQTVSAIGDNQISTAER